MSKPKGPVLIELDEAVGSGPDLVPPVPEVGVPTGDSPTGQAMQVVAQIATRRRSRLGVWFWRLLLAIIGFGLSLWAWDTLFALIGRNPVLGYGFSALIGGFVLICLAMVVREWAAFSRLARIDAVRSAAERALASGDPGAARKVSSQLVSLYSGRAELEWGIKRLSEQSGEVFDADGQLASVETELLAPLDAQVQRQIESAARQVATVTAIVPIAFADVAAALVANLRMIRRIAEIYGGRSGTFGSWRLARTVLTHLVATGAVAVGDDLITSVAGGGLVSKLSRRFGEGIINGALTARVGLAAMEVCRPLAFRTQKRPSVTGLVKRALTGVFSAK